MRTPSKSKKLLTGELVEVRQKEEGLRGAWHEGVVIESTALQRRVKYKNLVDDNWKDGLVETIRVRHAVEGWKSVELDRIKLQKRGYIRPLPPPLNVEMSWSYGLCVDALYDDGWWEGVILDNFENSPKRSVFFPDEGDEMMIPKENLRVAQDWDETSGSWVVRGHWMLSKLKSLCDSRGFSIKVVWYNVRTHRQFLSKLGEWMYGKKEDWIECLNQVFQLIEREPSRQLIPGLIALGTQSYLNRSSQFQNSNKTHDSSLDEDINAGSIVCCETVGHEWPLDAVVGQDTPAMLSENANNLIERIGNGFCNSGDFSNNGNCFDKELSKAFRGSSDADRRRSSRESRKAIGADVNERASSAQVNGMQQIYCVDRMLMKDVVNTTNTNQQTGHIDKELYTDVALGASLKDGSKGNQNQSFKYAPSEANSKGQTECIDMIVLENSTRDQFNSKNGSKLCHQISGRGKSLTLAGGELLHKPNAGHRPTSTSKPSASLNPDDCLDAVLNYNPFSNSSKVKQAKAKIYLLHQGWRIEVKCRISSERQDMHYISPKGATYYSLHQACLAWKEELKVQRRLDGHCEDVWVEGSASPSSQEPPLRVKRFLPKRLWRIDNSHKVPREDSNNGGINSDSKINNRSRQLFSRSKRLQGDGNKKRSCEGFSVSKLTHGTQACNFLSNSVAPSWQAPLPVSGWSSKRWKLNLEGSMDVHKQKEAKRSCHVWKPKGTPANWYRMPDLPATPRRLNDSSSCQDKPTDIFNLSWLIENGVVAENQQVYFIYGKEGWITSEGILCACCYRVHSLTSFEAHAGSKRHPFSVYLRLDDGRSLAQCQMQALSKRMRASSEAKRTRTPKENKMRAPFNKDRVTDPSQQHDDFCFICRHAGDIILCDRCTRSFHADCVHPEKIPTEEWIKWFCPNCRCDKCGGGEFSDDENFTESTVLFCDQCECLFHVGCLDDIGMPKLASSPQGKWFCSQKCSEIFLQLRNIVGKVNPVGVEGLSWTLLRSTEEDRDPSFAEEDEDRDPTFDEIIAEEDCYKEMAKKKLSVALSVMRECFSRIIEYRSRKDYVKEIIFNRGLLNFQGFYTAILEKGDKVISVATVRVHGTRVAEMPLIATRTQYRRKGMCRLLLNELEKLLISLQIEKIVLPAIYTLESTWKKSFGFRMMTSEDMFDLLKLDIVHFQYTIMLQKTLLGASPEQEIHTEMDGRTNRADGMHRSLGNINGLEIREETVSENPEINACKIRSCTKFVESVPPLRSLPCKTNTYVKTHSNSGEGGCFNGKMPYLSKGFQHNASASRKGYKIRKNKTKKIECHSGKTPMENDVDESSVVIMGTTRSNRLVKQVKRKIGYCRWEEHKPMRSVEHYFDDRKIYKRRMKERIIVSDKFPALSSPYTLESSQRNDIQFGTGEIREPDNGKSIICRTNSGIADGNCCSNVKADEPILYRPLLEHGSDHVAVNREVSGISRTLKGNENYRENCCGLLGSQYSFKYVYTRRRKKKCSGNALSAEIPSEVPLTAASSKLSFNLAG